MTTNPDHIKRYIDFISSDKKTLTIDLGTVNKTGLDYLIDASSLNNQFHRAVPALAHIVIRSYISKKEVTPGVWNVKAVFDKR